MSKNKNQKKNKQTKGSILATVSLILVGVLVLGMVGWMILDESGAIAEVNGLIGQTKIEAQSDNFKVTGSELSVYAFQAAQMYSQQAQMEYMYYQYGLYQDTYGITKQFSSAADYAAYIVDYYRSEGVLKEQAYHDVENYLAFCEGAKAAGFTSDKIGERVDEFMKQIKDAAEAAKVSYKSYVKSQFGPGVRDEDIRSAMEKYFTYDEYYTVLEEKFSGEVTDKELTDLRDKNKADYFTSEYISYELMNEAMKEAAAKCEDLDDVKAMICDYLTDTKFEELYSTYITKKDISLPAGVTKDSLKEDLKTSVKSRILSSDYKEKDPFSDTVIKDHKGKADEAFYKAAQSMAKIVETSAKTETNKVKASNSAAWADPKGEKATDLQKWLFAADRAEKDTWIEEKTKVNEDGDKVPSSYTLYLATKVMKLDTNHKRHVGYVLFSDTTKDATDKQKSEAAQKKAEAFLEELKKGEITEDRFEEIAKKHSTATTFFYDLNAATDSPTAVSEWAFKSERKEGDTSILTAKNDRYVAFYVEEAEDENWEAAVREKITTERISEWAKEAIEKYNVTTNHEHEEETTAVAETTTKAA